jgi:Domain of unknown function (DUF397)
MKLYDQKSALAWRKSTHSNSGGCLEVTSAKGFVRLRDSKQPHSPVLSIPPKAWTALIAQVRDSGIDMAS